MINAMQEFVQLLEKSDAIRTNFTKVVLQNKQGKNIYIIVNYFVKLINFIFRF